MRLFIFQQRFLWDSKKKFTRAFVHSASEKQKQNIILKHDKYSNLIFMTVNVFVSVCVSFLCGGIRQKLNETTQNSNLI